jgi:hypothetical protein
MTDEQHMQKAREIAEALIDQCEGCSCDDCTDSVRRIIASALSEAYRSGVEAERAECESIARRIAAQPGTHDARVIAILINDRGCPKQEDEPY